jgi:hypothetical protein
MRISHQKLIINYLTGRNFRKMTAKRDPGPDSHPTTNPAEYSGLYLQADDPVNWVFSQ